jgi:hypothetical protein
VVLAELPPGDTINTTPFLLRAALSEMAARVSRCQVISTPPNAGRHDATMMAYAATVFSVKGVPGNRRERVEAAVVAGGKSTRKPHEAWLAVDPRGTRACAHDRAGPVRAIRWLRAR